MSQRKVGANTEPENSPALITPIEMESEFFNLNAKTRKFTSASRNFNQLLGLAVEQKGVLTPMERGMFRTRLPSICSDMCINLENMLHPVADIHHTLGPKQGDSRADIVVEIENHADGRPTDVPLEDTDIGKDLAANIGRSTEGYFLEDELSEGQGIVFDAPPASEMAEEGLEKGTKPSVKIVLGEDGLKLDFESATATVNNMTTVFQNDYTKTVCSVLGNCRKGQCGSRNPDVTYVGSTPEEVSERIAGALELATRMNDGAIVKLFIGVVESAFDIAKRSKPVAGATKQEINSVIQDTIKAEQVIATLMNDCRNALPYINTTFVFNGEDDDYAVRSSVGASAADVRKEDVDSILKLCVAVNSISYDLMIDSFKARYDALVKENGFDVLNVDADISPTLAAVSFIYYRFIKAVVCGLIEHKKDLQAITLKRK